MKPLQKRSRRKSQFSSCAAGAIEDQLAVITRCAAVDFGPSYVGDEFAVAARRTSIDFIAPDIGHEFAVATR